MSLLQTMLCHFDAADQQRAEELTFKDDTNYPFPEPKLFVSTDLASEFIVRGHGRLAAALLLSCEAVPVDYQDYETEAEEWADFIADNRIAELA